MQPVDPFLEERVPAGHGLVVAPVVGCLQPVHMRREMREHHLADRAFGEQPPQADRERLVVIVLADEHDATGPVARARRP